MRTTGMPGRRALGRSVRRAVGCLTAAVLAAGMIQLAGPAAAAPNAPVAFTSNDLSTWQTDGVVWSLAQTGGVVFAGGTFDTIRAPGATSGGTAVANLASFDAATGAPASCQPRVTISSGTPTVRALDVSPDGTTLYVGGYFDAVDGVPVHSLAAIDLATCTPIASFHPQVSATVRTILSTGSEVYFGGDFNTVDGSTRHTVAAVDDTGALLPFAPATDGPVRAMVLSPDGTKLVLGGDFFHLNNADSHALGVVDASSGANVRTYPLGFIEKTSVVKDLVADATGFYTANEGTGGGVFDGRIALDWNTLDQRWRDTCLGATQALAIYQGVLYAGAHVHDCTSMGEEPDGRRQHLVAEPVDDPHFLDWYPDTNDGIGEGIGPRALSVAATGNGTYLWVGGEFTTVNGHKQQGLTRFGQGPDLAGPSTPAISASSLSPGTVKIRFRAAVDTDDATLTYRVYRDGGSTPIWTGTATSVWWSRPQVTVTDSGLAPGSWHSYRVTASDGANTSPLSPLVGVTAADSTAAYPARVVADGAQLYWRYAEPPSATFAADTSPGDENGLYYGGSANNSHQETTGAITGDPSQAAVFNGSNEYVYTEERLPQPTSYSIETWFKTTTTSGGLLVGFGNGQVLKSSDYDKHVYMTDAGRLVFGTYNGGCDVITSPGAYDDGAWHQVVATQGADGMRLYVDGALVASNSVTTNQAYSGFWHVGGDNLSGWPSRPSSDYFSGALDETAIYPSVLTAGQVAAHYALGSGS